jgi:hypothetical protein
MSLFTSRSLMSCVSLHTTHCSHLKVNWCFGGTRGIHLQDWRISQARTQHEACNKLCLAYSSVLKMDATYSSEMSVDFQRNTRRCIPENRTLHNHCCEDLCLSTYNNLRNLNGFSLNFVHFMKRTNSVSKELCLKSLGTKTIFKITIMLVFQVFYNSVGLAS